MIKKDVTLFRKSFEGFTLIEMLVVIAIIGILATVSIFALQGAREAARNNRRKADIEVIRSGLELYRSDCRRYATTADVIGEILTNGSLNGDGSTSACSSSNVYIQAVPNDPQSGKMYLYVRTSSTTYEICASLEGESGSVSCGGVSLCGFSTCNYRVTNP